MKVMLTGASGFVGRNLFISLLTDPRVQKIVLPVREPRKLTKQWEQDGIRVSENKVEVIETAAPEWHGLGSQAVDVLIHSAGILFARAQKDFFDTNVKGTLNLLKQVKYDRAVVLSSQAASGPCQAGQNTKTENDVPEPITWYGRSKLEMERLVQEQLGDKNIICIRPPIILGARDTATLPLFKMVKGRVLFKPGLKPKYYSYIAVKDLVRAIEQVIWVSNPLKAFQQKVYFVASEEVITDETLIVTAAAAAKKRGVLLKIPQPLLKGIVKVVDAVPAWREAIPSLSSDRAQEIWPDRWVVSSHKFQQMFEWQAKCPLLETLKETHDWYVRNGDL
ncbi:NAD-dependent epimerase/dehydratase family protein [bacterium]|nr:NAD-dependent epimerase/dehydratase family protein [bacterium]NBX82898.1 NAD-dependent epimerase/dehydratase family protein [bacterium]